MLHILCFSGSHWALNLSGARYDDQRTVCKALETLPQGQEELFPPRSAITGWSCVQDKYSGKALGTFPNNEVNYPRREQAPLARVIQQSESQSTVGNDLGSRTDALRDIGLHPAPHAHKVLLLQALDLLTVIKKVGFI